MNKYVVTFEENGCEYTGSLIVTCNKINKIAECEFTADGIHIEIDEKIISIHGYVNERETEQ